MEPENENDVHPTEDSARVEPDISNLSGDTTDESGIEAEPGAQSADKTVNEDAVRDGMADIGAQSSPSPEAQGSASSAESQSAHLRIEIDLVEGDLTILGGSPQVLLDTEADEPDDDTMDQSDNAALRFTRLPDDSELRVPDGAEVLVRRIYGDLRAEHFDGFVLAQRVSGDADIERVAVTQIAQLEGELTAQHGGSLTVRTVNGDARIEDYDEAPILGHISGDLDASDLPGLEVRDSVSGSVELDRCGTVTLLGTVGGDLEARRSTVILRGSSVGGDVHISSVLAMTVAAIGGDLDVDGAVEAIEVHSVGGDADIRDARGPVQLSTVGGDLQIKNATGGLSVKRVGGDASIDTALGDQTDYTVHASGDITLWVREDVNARFVARTFGGEIKTRLPLSVERGRRRNLVGVLGHGSSTVTLVSEGGDISIAASDRYEKEQSMGEDFEKQDKGSTTDTLDSRTWEGSIGGQRFRVRWDRAPGRANFHFQGPVPEHMERDDLGSHSAHDIHFEWEKGQGARMYGEYEERLNDLRQKAEKAAKKAAEQAQEYAEKATKRARETDWEAIGRDVRTAVEKAMSELEASFSQLRREWDSRRGNGSGSAGGGSKPGAAQRVRIEYDDDEHASASAAGSEPSQDDLDYQRRTILEKLRSGELSLDEAERRLNDLR